MRLCNAAEEDKIIQQKIFIEAPIGAFFIGAN